MPLGRVSYEQVKSELREISAGSTDALTDTVHSQIVSIAAVLRASPVLDLDSTRRLLRQNVAALDVFRLLLGKSQDVLAHLLGAKLGVSGGYSRFKALARKDPGPIAGALLELGLTTCAREQVSREWTLEDVLKERYNLGRGRAIAGQKRGRFVEDATEEILKDLDLKYGARCNFVGKEGRTAKAEFAIPQKERPRVVIECKGYEATGSKMTDVLGDILKIVEARDFHMYFFVVTDGRGWLNREPDLKRIVNLHHAGKIDMIYTLARLDDLRANLREIFREHSSAEN